MVKPASTPLPVPSTYAFVMHEWRFLIYGILMSLWSSFGQTFFISLFSAEIRAELALTHGEFGSYYALATTASAVCLYWVGKLADTVGVPRLSLMTLGAVCLAAMHFSFVFSVASLTIGLFLLRLTGQGMMYHVYSTAVARRYQQVRGRALAFSGFGMNIGEAVFPILVIFLLGMVEWRVIWLVLPLCVLASFGPFIPYLTQRTSFQDGPGRQKNTAAYETGQPNPEQTGMRREQVIKDPIFWSVIIWLMMIPGFIITGIFFHQIHIAQLKDVPLWVWSSYYIWYALAAVGGAFISGMLIDRFTAHRIAASVQVFLLLACLLLLAADGAVMLGLFFICFGASGGVMQPVINALLAERYGTRWLGEIKALASPLNVFSSALSPVVMGMMFDAGYMLQSIVAFLSVLAALNVVMPFIWFNLLRRVTV